MNYETRHSLIMVMETMPTWIDISHYAAIEKLGINRETHALPPGRPISGRDILGNAAFGVVR